MKDIKNTLNKLGIKKEQSGYCDGTWSGGGKNYIESYSPVDGSLLGKIREADINDYRRVSETAHNAFLKWRNLPVEKRYNVVRQIGLKLREYKELLGTMISIEMGKVLPEAREEVQGMIDMCDFATGMSGQFHGLAHSVGTVGVITAFTFPVSAWSRYAMPALASGNSIIWKPSSETPLCAIAVHNIIKEVLAENHVPREVLSLITGRGSSAGEELIKDRMVPVICFAGSKKTGKHVAKTVGERQGKHILDTGGKCDIIVSDKLRDISNCIASITVSALETAGQSCRSAGRLILHESIYDRIIEPLVNTCRKLPAGNPLDERTMMGPLVNKAAVLAMQKTVERARSLGGKIIVGGNLLPDKDNPSGCYVYPCIIEVEKKSDIVQEETCVPILYVIKSKTILK